MTTLKFSDYRLFSRIGITRLLYLKSPVTFYMVLACIALLLSACSPANEKNKDTKSHNSTNSLQVAKPTAKSTSTESIHIAAATNLTNILPLLISSYHANHSGTNLVDIEVTYSSSGKLFAQINAGAPYDIFLSANQAYPAKLARRQVSKQTNRPSTQLSTRLAPSTQKLFKPFTYAQGQLAWYSTRHSLPPPSTTENAATAYNVTSKARLPVKLRADTTVAIANPQLAPYGASAQTYLKQVGLYNALKQQRRLIQAENIGQAFHYAHMGSVDYGLVALPQVIIKSAKPSQYQTLSTHSYPPILQDGIVLTSNPVAVEFASYLQTAQVQQQLAQVGYLPISQ